MRTQKTLNMNLPTIKQLKCFVAVCEEMNFRKAAERMNMTQPPLTRQIQNLEYLIGQTLFLRDTHEVSLTQAATAFYPEVVKVLEHLHQVTQRASQKSHVRMGCTRVINFENIPNIHKKLKKVQPDFSKLQENLTSKQLLKNLIDYNLDIAITGEQPIKGGRLSFHYIFTERLRVVFPCNHAAAVKKKVSLKDLEDLPLYWFARNENVAWYDKCEEAFRKLNLNLKKIKEPKEFILMFDHIAKGRGMALIPESMWTIQHTGCASKPLCDPDNNYLNIDVYAAIRKEDDANKAIYEKLLLLF